MKTRIDAFHAALLMTALAAATPAESLRAQTFKRLHSFNGLDGNGPQAGLVLSGNTLYGTTYGGGNSGLTGAGTVFAVNTDGTAFRTLHSFPISDGSSPRTGMVLSGNTLYGATAAGGIMGVGTVFAINTDGTGFTTLYTFSGTDGRLPYYGQTLIISGGTLYGTTFQGGTSFGSGSGGLGYGTVFAINTDGTSFATLYNFTGATDGANPVCGLVLSGNTLYGTTLWGGNQDVGNPLGSGAVFAVNSDGTGFTTLYSFTSPNTNGINSDGAYPWGNLILSGSTLYGTAGNGGSAGAGTVFKINTDGTGFAVLHTFTGSIMNGWVISTNGVGPGPGLVLSGNALYGVTGGGGIYAGNYGYGTVFALNTDGTGFTVLHRFAGGDGSDPYAALLLSGNTLYGTAPLGGSGNLGTIFSISFNPPQLTIGAAGTNVILTWPTSYAGFDYTGYTVQSTTNLGSSAVWTTNLPAPVVVSGQNTVTNSISGTQQFYRLSQ